jgi:hypothetical protein
MNAMTTYVLSLTGDEEKAANATHWTRFRKAKLVSVSRHPGPRPPADAPGLHGIVVVAHGATGQAETPGNPVQGGPEALAALLVRTLDIQDGTRVVLAHFDCEDYAADVVAQIAALGREVVCSGKAASFAYGASVVRRAS